MINVIIVDDNSVAAEAISDNIDWEKSNVTVIGVFYDSYQALNFSKCNTIDIIISDIEMPGLTGIDLTRNILERYTSAKAILISAYDKFEYAMQGIRLGVIDYIEKPIDFLYLEEKIGRVVDRISVEKKNRRILSENQPIMLSNFFGKLLHMQCDEAYYQLVDYPNFLNIGIDCDFYMVVKINIRNSFSLKKKVSIEEYHLQLLEIKNWISDNSKSFELCYIQDDFLSLICIFGCNDESNVFFHNRIYHIAENALNYSKKETLLELTISLGSVVKKLWEISSSYEKTSNVLQDFFFSSDQEIYDAIDQRNWDTEIDGFFQDSYKDLFSYIQQKNTTLVNEWIDCFFDKAICDKVNKPIIFLKIASILGELVEISKRLFMDNNIESKIVQFIKQFNSNSTSLEVKNTMKNICYVFCCEIEKSEKTYNNMIGYKVDTFINEKYIEKGLNLNVIADYVNLSPAYLSSLYKRITGKNIIDTINTKRIDTACELLQFTHYSIKDISEKVGYSNQYYFSASFKKIKRESPSDYRRNNSCN